MQQLLVKGLCINLINYCFHVGLGYLSYSLMFDRSYLLQRLKQIAT